MKMKKALAVIAMSAVMPGMAWAAGKVVIETWTEEGTMQTGIEFDGDKLRMEVPGTGMDAYMIMREGRIYSVANQNGQPFVVDISSLGEQFGNHFQMADDDIQQLIALDETGRTETVAGVKGKVYIATYTDPDGRRQSDEVVIGRHPVLREMSDTMVTMSRTMTDVDNSGTYDQLLAKGDGILRFGSDYQVVSLQQSGVSPARFELPAEPRQMPNFGAMFSGQNAGAVEGTNDPDASAEEDGGLLGRFFGRQADRQQQRTENRAQRETDRATDRAVDNAIDKTFEKIFGR